MSSRRIATDAGANDIGWQLDNLAFQGITNAPFSAFVADQSRCRGVPKKERVNRGPPCRRPLPPDRAVRNRVA
jgi:hypothetical protein